MGYEPGSALGKEGSGRAEPIGIEIRRSRAGIRREDPVKEKMRREKEEAEKERRNVEELMVEFGSRQKSQWRSRRVSINFDKAKAALDQLENREVVAVVEPEEGESQEEEEEEEITEEDLEKGKDFDEEKGDSQAKIEKIKRELQERKMAAKAAGNEGEAESIFSEKRFEDYGISPLTIKALTTAGYVQMTRAQEATLPVCLEGKDALVKAKAGTGKSAAFLVPTIEEVIKAMGKDAGKRITLIYALIICPTRELASQISAETRVLLRYHDGLGVQTLIGGTRFKDDLKRLELDPCQIVVATPGRLMDHVECKSAFSKRLTGLKVLILDEADQLLNLGFRKDIERIVDCLPRRRESLLFSATVPKEVRRISQMVLKREHVFIDSVGTGCLETNSKVKQLYIVAPLEQQFHVVHEILREHISQTPDYKVIVFNATGMVTSLMYLLFREMQLNVRELHSRKPQLYRSRITEEFKQSKQMILISSDVSARGMNYPDVTLVLQVGIPPDREQYIHAIYTPSWENRS